jgi:aspartate beta-hydroxylase
MASPYEQNRSIRAAVTRVMKQGGYYNRVMDSGPELDRVKRFLRILAEEEPPIPLLPLQNPTFLPVFPGLSHQPFHDRAGDPIAAYLERAVSSINAEASAIHTRAFSEKKGEVVTDGLWEIYPMWYMGLDIPFLTARVPQLRKLVEGLPRSAFLHPFGEALLSWQQPGTHLRRHCSVDAFRKRYSVGVLVQDACELRVGSSSRSWTAGESLIFEDCFEHEAFNAAKERLVFIVDTWHPDLTEQEIEALLAGLRKKEVRRILFEFRLAESLRGYLIEQFEAQDAEPRIGKYWDRVAKLEPLHIDDWGTWKTTTRFK